MFSPFKTRIDTLVAERGRVACSTRVGDTDIDICFECPQVREIVQGDDGTVVRCAPERRKHDGWTYRTWNLPTE
jgi:hypothetical protein